MANVSPKQVHHIANLANIPISDDEAQKLANAFDETLRVIDNLQELDTSDVEPTHQVTNLENVFRDDVVREEMMFSQGEALANASASHNGYFVIDQVIDQDDK